MKIVLCNGGLGNQTFQYIFCRYLELASGEECYLDDSSFWGRHVAHNGFEIKKVFPNSRPRLLSQLFTPDVWEYMLDIRQNKGMGICQQLKANGMAFTLVAETDDYVYDGNVVKVPTNAYIPRIAESSGDLYFHGYWINKWWLKDTFWNILQTELQFPIISDERNRGYLSEISNTESVMLHIRRGDFVNCHWDAPVTAYNQAVTGMKNRINNAHFFVFSDDIPWCKEHSIELGLQGLPTTYIVGNMDGENFRDMQLMATCKNMILVTSSSFSYLATLLNENKDIMVLNLTGREV